MQKSSCGTGRRRCHCVFPQKVLLVEGISLSYVGNIGKFFSQSPGELNGNFTKRQLRSPVACCLSDKDVLTKKKKKSITAANSVLSPEDSAVCKGKTTTEIMLLLTHLCIPICPTTDRMRRVNCIIARPRLFFREHHK